MRIRPTELGFKGILLFCALGVAFLAASYSNLFFLILAFCAVLGVLGLWWTVRHTRNLRLTVLDVPLAAAGSERQLTLSLGDARGKTRFDIALAIDLDGTRVELLHVPVLQRQARMAATLPALERGLRTITSVLCISRFPFGLFQVTRRLPVTLEIVTFPRPPASTERAAMAHSATSETHNNRSTEVAGLRPFRTGDSQGDVHWKASARRGKPIVKEREYRDERSVEVVLDRRCGDDSAALELLLSRGVGFVMHAVSDERSLQVRSQDHAVTVAPGRSVDSVLRWLATATSLPLDAPAPLRIEEAARV